MTETGVSRRSFLRFTACAPFVVPMTAAATAATTATPVYRWLGKSPLTELPNLQRFIQIQLYRTGKIDVWTLVESLGTADLERPDQTRVEQIQSMLQKSRTR